MAELTEAVIIPAKLVELATLEPRNRREFRVWCQQCIEQFETLELKDARCVNPNELHEHAALLVRQAHVFVRRFIDPARADRMPRVSSKFITYAIVRLQECIEWCDNDHNANSKCKAEHGERDLPPSVVMACQMALLAKEKILSERSFDDPGRCPTYAEMHRCLASGLAAKNGYKLRSLETWQRYVSQGREHFGLDLDSSSEIRPVRSAITQEERDKSNHEAD